MDVLKCVLAKFVPGLPKPNFPYDSISSTGSDAVVSSLIRSLSIALTIPYKSYPKIDLSQQSLHVFRTIKRTAGKLAALIGMYRLGILTINLRCSISLQGICIPTSNIYKPCSVLILSEVTDPTYKHKSYTKNHNEVNVSQWNDRFDNSIRTGKKALQSRPQVLYQCYLISLGCHGKVGGQLWLVH